VIELSRYVFEVRRKGEEFILYRGQNQDDASRVLVLSPAGQSFTLEILKRLEHEYSLKEELCPTWVARPLAIARHWDRTVLVLEDPGGLPLDQWFDPARTDCASGGAGEASASHALGSSGDIALLLRLAISLASALGHLHRRGIIHKDIKPANILVDSASGNVWLTGFGIASRLPRERQAPEPPEVIAGTLAYMAPEQTGRMNRSIDFR
jgi:hypothetical protein